MSDLFHSHLYRGKRLRRKWVKWVTIALIALIVLFAIAAFLFYGLQKYVIYTQDGVKVEFPIMKEDSQTAEDLGDPSKQDIVVEKTDTSTVTATAGYDLDSMKAVYIDYTSVSKDHVLEVAEGMTEGNALVLQLKAGSGQLSYKSSVREADGYQVNGTEDLAAIVKAVKKAREDIWLVGELSCCVDSFMSQRNAVSALHTSDGDTYSDGNGGWIDPTSSEMRSYIIDLGTELADMGFDEILLTNVMHPSASTDQFDYVDENAGDDATSIINSYILSVARSISSKGVKVSAVGTRDAISDPTGTMTGQDIKMFTNVCDRIYCYTDAESYTEYQEACSKYFTVGDKAYRFVPIVSGDLPETECWVLGG
jgi:hypothetical protein